MMRKLLFTLTLVTIFFSACTGVMSTASGLEDESFLRFIGNPSVYPSEVSVLVDGTISFKAEVERDYAKRPKGTIYAISKGAHNIKVTHENTVIFNKKIFISAQETKKILLP